KHAHRQRRRSANMGRHDCNQHLSSTKLFPNASLVPRVATTFHISPMVTDVVTVNGNNQGCQLREHKEKNTAQPYGSDGNHPASHANKNHQHATTTRERPHKNNRILRTNHHDPRPPCILSQAVSKSRCSAERTFPDVF